MIVFLSLGTLLLLSNSFSISNDERGDFDFTCEGSMSFYFDVDVSRLPDYWGFKLSQPFFIKTIIEAAGFDSNTTKVARDNTPAAYTLLIKDENVLPRKAPWNYRAVINMLGYLQGTSRPDITVATHQCTCFNNNPMILHERSVKRIVEYLLDSKDGELQRVWNAMSVRIFPVAGEMEIMTAINRFCPELVL